MKLHKVMIPSRQDNPFATCWTKPGAIPFRFTDGHSAARLIAKLASHNWRGAIIGPHGSGKSTLLEALKPELVAAGCRIEPIVLCDRQRHFPGTVFHALCIANELDCIECASTRVGDPHRRLLIVDGFEQLGWLDRTRLHIACRRYGTGLLITSHRGTRLPTLVRLAPDRRLIEQLVDQLCAEVSPRVTKSDVAASLACHGSNVREVFFDLYDRHERLRRVHGTFRLRRA